MKKKTIPKNLSQYDLRLLRIFKTVVECGGFSSAESVLGIGRSTISIHMSSLETRMGFKLCLRGRGGFALTHNGQQVYHRLIELFESLEDFSIFINNLGTEFSGELVILCTDLFIDSDQERLADVFAKAHQKAPNLRVQFDTDTVANIEMKLLNDKAHIGLLPPYQRIDGLEYQIISSEMIYLCCSSRHPLFEIEDDRLTDEDIASFSAIHPGLDIDPEGREKLHKLRLQANAYQFSTRKTLIMSGAYIGFMPLSHIENDIRNNSIRLLKPEKNSYTFNLSMVSRKAPKESRKVELIKSLFFDSF